MTRSADRSRGRALARSRLSFFGAATAAAFLIPSMAGAQDSGAATNGSTSRVEGHAAAPVARAVHRTGEIRIDGTLDRNEWDGSTPVSEFIQTDPIDGAPATERTEVYFKFDDAALYVGARMWDSSGEVRQRLGRRDSFLFDTDWFSISLDSYHDHLTAFEFGVNPSGVKRDLRPGTGGERPGGNNTSWDAVWDAATSVDDEGWTAEMRIPFSQLRFKPADLQTWGIQVERSIVNKRESVVLAHTPKSERGGVARYGHLTGLEQVEPARRFELLPYTVARAEYLDAEPDNPFRDGSDYFGGAGMDLKYRVTSSMTLDATINPDFGQVELDPAVVNLSAFETSFDEKRPFFVEGADIFRFNELRLFYSRRIGRPPQGSLPDGTVHSNRPDNSTILGAAKLSGQTANGWNIGVVNALTSEESARAVDDQGQFGDYVVEPMANYFAARAEKNMRQGQTTAGAIVTAVNRNLSGSVLEDALRSSAYAGGLDVSHEFANRTWQVQGYMAYSRVNGSAAAILHAQESSARYYGRPDADYLDLDSARTSLEGYAGRLGLRKNAGLHWRGDVNVSATSPGFEVNDLGFQTQVDRLGADINLMYVENEPGPFFRNYRINLRNSGDWNYGWDRIGGRSNFSFNYSLVNYWGGNINYMREFESVDDRLTRGGPVALNPSANQFEFRLNTNMRDKVHVRSELSYRWSESGGWEREVAGNLSLRLGGNWSLSFGPRYRESRTSAQYRESVLDSAATRTFGYRYLFSPLDQTTLSMDTRLNVTFSPELSFELFAQPFVSTGDYGEMMQLRAPRTYEFEPYLSDGTEDEDFRRTSLRGNAVMRWEWRPGSTLFVVWQQRRSASYDAGDFRFGRDSRAIFDQRPNNVFLIKMNYWLNF
ncbi:MAG: DUF5916 domain-containing protein [Longimicrobiales bacterium]